MIATGIIKAKSLIYNDDHPFIARKTVERHRNIIAIDGFGCVANDDGVTYVFGDIIGEKRCVISKEDLLLLC